MKYQLDPGDTRTMGGVTLTRIRRIPRGEKGGYVETEANLSQDGACFIHGDSTVSGAARVEEDAQIYGTVSGHATVRGSAQIHGRVEGHAVVEGRATVSGTVKDRARIGGSVRVLGVVGGDRSFSGDETLTGLFD